MTESKKRTYTFKNKEIVVKLPEGKVSLSSQDVESEVEGKIVIKGEEASKYEVGDTIVFDKKKASKFSLLGDNYWRIPIEDWITCKIEIED